MPDKKCVAVIFGGQSSEHEVSRASAQFVIKNVNRDKYDIVMVGITREGRWLYYNGPVEKIGTGEWQEIAEANVRGSLDRAKMHNTVDDTAGELSLYSSIAGNFVPALLSPSGAKPERKKIDVVFPVLHGCNGEDGTIQGVFELAGIPYVGAGVLGSALGMDKAYAKIMFEKEGIPQGKYLVFTRKDIDRDLQSVIEKVEALLAYPCFVKPSNSGSSVGVSKAYDRDKLVKGLNTAARYDKRILVEEFIDGREVECSVLGNDDPVASTVGEIIPCNEFYDYDAKYSDSSTSQVIIPANLPQETIDKVREYAVRAFKAIDCAGLARVDFFIRRGTGEVVINEINTMPGFTSISMYPKLWEASGLSSAELVERLIELAIEKHEEKKRSIDKQ